MQGGGDVAWQLCEARDQKPFGEKNLASVCCNLLCFDLAGEANPCWEGFHTWTTFSAHHLFLRHHKEADFQFHPSLVSPGKDKGSHKPDLLEVPSWCGEYGKDLLSDDCLTEWFSANLRFLSYDFDIYPLEKTHPFALYTAFLIVIYSSSFPGRRFN